MSLQRCCVKMWSPSVHSHGRTSAHVIYGNNRCPFCGKTNRRVTRKSAAKRLSRIESWDRLRAQAGFTIFEILVTLLLASITLGIALPSLQTFSANNQILSASNSIVSGLNFARFTAITTGDDITICPSEDGISCLADSWHRSWIVFNDQNEDSVPDPDEVLRTTALDGSVTISGFGQPIVFKANGTTALASAAFISSCYEHSGVTHKCMRIMISAFGSIGSTEQEGPPEA